MKTPKTPEDRILEAIAQLAERQTKLEITMNEMVVAHMELSGAINTLSRALIEEVDELDGAEPIDPPSDLPLDKWMAEQRKKGG